MNKREARKKVNQLIVAASDCGHYAAQGKEGTPPHDQKKIDVLDLAAEIVRRLVGEPTGIEPPFCYRIATSSPNEMYPFFASSDSVAVGKTIKMIADFPCGTTTTLIAPDGVVIGRWAQ